MQSLSILMGILPLLAFVIIDSFFGIRAGLISALVLAVAEACFSYIYFGELDSITLASLFLVFLMGVVALKKESKMVFLFQPVILSAGLGFYLVISYLLGYPIILDFMLKYKSFFPVNFQEQLNYEFVQNVFRALTYTSGIGFLLHALLNAFAALKLNKWWWIGIKAIGPYVFFFLSYLAAVFIVRLQA